MYDDSLRKDIEAHYDRLIGQPEKRKKVQALVEDIKEHPDWLNKLPEPDVSKMSLYDEVQARADYFEKKDLLGELKQHLANVIKERQNEIQNSIQNYSSASQNFKNISQNTMQNAIANVQNFTNPLGQGAKALGNATVNYFALRPMNINDKYKHSVVSMTGAQGGVASAGVTGFAGILKEGYDIIKKSADLFQGHGNYKTYGDILRDSWGDLKADGQGLVNGLINPSGNPHTTTTNYYTPYIKR